MLRALSADVLADSAADVGEGPTWDRAANCLVWVDITQGMVHLTESTGQARASYPCHDYIGAALPIESGEGWLLARRADFVRLAADGAITPVLNVLDDPAVRFNDAKCDPLGRAFAGTMMYDYETARGRAALYRLDDGPQVTMVRRGVTLGNGLGWSPDSKQMYFIDSTTQTVVAIGYDPATGQLGADRILCTIPVADGLPDGLCVDDSGAVWVALFGGSAIHRFSADGDLDTVVQLPVSQVTSCAFGGAGGATLYITSARRGLGPAALTEQPHAGAVFALDPGVTGPAATGWRPVAGAPVA